MPACGQDETGITFDHVGTFGYNMIVTCDNGLVWQVDGTGIPTFIADAGTHLEGPAIPPLSFGPYGGQILAADEDSGGVHAIDNAGNITYDLFSNYGAEAVLVIPSAPCTFCDGGGAQFQAIQNFQSGNVYQYPLTDFAGLGGNILVTSEFGGGTALVTWDGANYNTVFFDDIPGGEFEGASFADCDIPPASPTPTPDSHAYCDSDAPRLQRQPQLPLRPLLPLRRPQQLHLLQRPPRQLRSLRRYSYRYGDCNRYLYSNAYRNSHLHTDPTRRRVQPLRHRNGDRNGYLYSNSYCNSHVHTDANPGRKSNAHSNRYGNCDSHLYSNSYRNSYVHSDSRQLPLRRLQPLHLLQLLPLRLPLHHANTQHSYATPTATLPDSNFTLHNANSDSNSHGDSLRLVPGRSEREPDPRRGRYGRGSRKPSRLHDGAGGLQRGPERRRHRHVQPDQREPNARRRQDADHHPVHGRQGHGAEQQPAGVEHYEHRGADDHRPGRRGRHGGWRLATNGHTIKSVRSTGATQYGILVLGNSNSVSINSVSGSPVGIRVTGNANDLRPGGTLSGNSGNGVEIGSTATGNTVRIGNIQSNGGNGIQVDGSGNTVTSNGRVDNNTLNGILVNGSNNTITNNAAGSDSGKGNGGAGITVGGGGNTLDSNKANANGGVGFDLLGAGNKLKNNQSNQSSAGGSKENSGCEYRFGDNTTQDQGSNKKDNKSFVGGLSGPKYAAGCYE